MLATPFPDMEGDPVATGEREALPEIERLIAKSFPRLSPNAAMNEKCE